MKKNHKQETYTYSEVLRSIEGGIDLWEFAKKFKIHILERYNVLELLLLCTDNDKEASKSLYQTLIANSKMLRKDDGFNYNTLISLAKKGYCKIDIMKYFGKTSYSSFSTSIKKLYRKENIDDKKQKELSKMLKNNIKAIEVFFIPDVKKEIINTEITESNILKSEAKNNDTPLFSDKLVIYTIEYLQLQGNKIVDELFDGANEERIILSTTLSKYMKNDSNSELAKIQITEAINEKMLSVLVTTSEYPANHTNKNSADNDTVLSQALMLRRHTDKTICIATREPQTAINSLSLGFEIRIPKNILIQKFSDITNQNIKDISYYFDYNLPENLNLSKKCSNENVVILDSCILIDNAAKSASTNKEVILSDTTQLKILPRIVLDELRGGPQVFFTSIFASKCNPTIVLDLNMKITYNFEDIAILNYAMYYQLTTGSEVTILTHDKSFYLEALKYNMKVRYYPSTYMNTFKQEANVALETKDVAESICDLEDQSITLDNKNDINDTESNCKPTDPVYYESLKITFVSSKPVILNNNKINCVKKSSSMCSVELKGHKGYKYYPVELGDFVSFKEDPNLYKIISLNGKNNLESVDIVQLNSGLSS